jgi:hypothetical protein
MATKSSRNRSGTASTGVPAESTPPVGRLWRSSTAFSKLCPACDCLREIAHYAGVRFFSEVVELPDNELDYSVEAMFVRLRMNIA